MSFLFSGFWYNQNIEIKLSRGFCNMFTVVTKFIVKFGFNHDNMIGSMNFGINTYLKIKNKKS